MRSFNAGVSDNGYGVKCATGAMKTLILYSKPGCHLCEGLQEKLAELPIQLEVRDITQNEMWFQKYQYEVPVLCAPSERELSASSPADGPVAETSSGAIASSERPLPRLSPRASIAQVAQMLQTHIGPFEA
jgi:glutaredoxin